MVSNKSLCSLLYSGSYKLANLTFVGNVSIPACALCCFIDYPQLHLVSSLASLLDHDYDIHTVYEQILDIDPYCPSPTITNDMHYIV